MAASNNLCMDSLPDDIIVEILQRFPQDIIHRDFKCVSKRWLNVIMSENFVTSYKRYHTCVLNSKPSLALFHGKKNKLCAFSDNPLFDRSGFSFEFLPPYCSPPSCSFVSSSNGLVLFESTYQYYVCNPLTKQWVTIPKTPEQLTRVPPLTQSNVESNIDLINKSKRDHIGFICKPTSTSCSFRIVQFYRDFNSQEFEVYDSETKQWTKSVVYNEGFSIRDVSYFHRKANVCNGLLHWRNGYEYIFVYDPFNTSHKCRKIPVPHHGVMRLGACNDHLRYFGKDKESFRVWELEDYNTGKWSLVQEIRFDQIKIEGSKIISNNSLMLLAIHPFDENIVFLQDNDEIIWYDVRLNIGKMLCRPVYGEIYPIVLPCWPVSVPKL